MTLVLDFLCFVVQDQYSADLTGDCRHNFEVELMCFIDNGPDEFFPATKLFKTVPFDNDCKNPSTVMLTAFIFEVISSQAASFAA